jgi:predicted RNA methylase
MLRLARASNNDVFYDLGCGRAQLCITAVSEFGVKRAVGIERLKRRADVATKRIRKLGLHRRIEIRNEEFYDSDLSDATIAYNGLTEEQGDLVFYESSLRRRCRLVTLSLPVVGVLPSSVDYPFYLLKMPFRMTRKVSDWVRAVLSKRASLREFFDEIGDDPDYWNDVRTLRSLVRKRFS